MKRLLLIVCCLGLWWNAGVAQAPTDPNEGARLTSGANGFHTFSWWVRSENLYYLQWSVDMVTWNYFPYVLLGDPGNDSSYFFDTIQINNGSTFVISHDASESYHFQLSSSQVFVRAEIQPLTLPLDSDGDGIADFLEILNSRDPFSAADSDGDLLPDDWERFWFAGSLGQNGLSNPDGDAFNNAEEFLIGLNPNVNDSAAASLPELSYDALGRLQTAGSVTYSYDAEGNILTAGH